MMEVFFRIVQYNFVAIVKFFFQGVILLTSSLSPEVITRKRMRGVWLFLLIITPIPVVGQFILPFLYMPLKRIFTGDFGPQAKYDKVTIHHVRTEEDWTLEFTYSENLDIIKVTVFSFAGSSSFTAANLENLDYYWSYSVPFNELDSNYSNHLIAAAKTPADYQKELLTFVSQRFVFDLDKVASNLGIPTTNLSSSYDPANWETVVHAMVNESSSAFSRLLELPTVNALAELMDIEVQDFLNVNLSRFEKMVFPFLPKKAILDKNSTSSLINNSGILPGESYNDVTLAKVLQHHENISFSTREFGILYNLTREQAKAIGKSTFYQIFRVCGISIETLLSITLPEVSWKVVGSLYILPPCPVLISIKGKSIESFKSSVNILNANVLEILTDVSNLTWRQVYESVNVSLPDWEFLDSVTLPQLSEIGQVSLETLLNDSVSEAVVLLLKLRADGSLINKTENHRLFVRTLLRETFNLSLSDVANLTALSEASLQGASSPLLFRRFLEATIANFRLNLSDIFFSLQLSEETLYNLPKQEWKSVIVTIVDSVVQSESRDLQTSTENLLTFLGVQSVELSIAKLKELIEYQILDAKRHKKKFETAPIIMYLSQNAVSDDAYLNSFVLSLVLSASGFNSSELKLLYGYNSEQRFILQSLRINDLPLYCALNTSTVKNKTPFNITAELVGTREVVPLCTSTSFYVSARTKNMSQLKSEFSLFRNSSVSFVTLVEKVTGLPWRRNVWAFGLKMEDWTVLYVLNEDSYKEVTSSLQLDPYLSTTLLKILEKSVELKDVDNVDIRAKIIEHRASTLNFLYDLFNTNEAELMHFGSKSKEQYDVLFPIEVFALTIQYLVDKFNVSVSRMEVSLDLNPGELEKLSPTEWREMIPFVKNEIIRSGENQLGVSMKNFAQLLQEKPENLQNVSLAQLESKWDSMFFRLLRGKEVIETETLLQIITAIGITSGSIDEVTFLKFIEEKINISISEVLLLYNYSSIGIDVLGNYTILETRGFCNLSEGNFLSKRPQDLIESLLGVDNEMSCRKIALVVAASTLTVNDLASKFSLEVADNVSLLTMFEDLFKLPWPKIAWAVNASLADWPILGAINLNTVGQLVSKTAAIMKSQESFREITMQLLSLSKNSYSQLLDEYRAKIVSKAGELFSVNSSRICDNCDVEDILWNSLRQLNQVIDFDPQMLPNQLNVSPYEFNLTVPSHWSVMVQHIVRDSYSRATVALGMDRDRLSSFLRTSTEIVENMTLHQYQAVFTQSIQPLIVAKTALNNSPLLDLVAAKGLNLSNLYHESIFNVIDAILNISAQNASFIFNWTTEQQAKLKNYTLDDLSYYKGVSFHDLGSERPLSLVEFTIQQLFTPRTIAPPTLLPCKRGTVRSGNDANCSGNTPFLFLSELENYYLFQSHVPQRTKASPCTLQTSWQL